jgi:hypothetical protein
MTDEEITAQAAKYRLASKAIDWIGTIGVVVVVGLFADPIAHAIAGRHTTISLTVGVSISLAGVAAVVIALGRARSLRKRNIYLRDRVSELERTIRELKRGGSN